MAVGITLVKETVTEEVVKITVTGLLGLPGHVTVHRGTGASGAELRTFRRRYHPGLTSSIEDYDFEPPQNMTLHYYVVVYDMDGNVVDDATDSVTAIDRGADWLYAVSSDDGDGVQVIVRRGPDKEREVGRSKTNVIGRSDPVIISDVRRDWSGKVELATLTTAAAAKLREILATGGLVALAQHDQSYGEDPVTYLSIDDVTESRATGLAVETARLWELTADAVAPGPIIGSNLFYLGTGVLGGTDVLAP